MRSWRWWRQSWMLGLLGLGISFLPTAVSAAPGRVLILHDSGGANGWVGGMHARMLANLLGHFNRPVDWRAVESYQSGDLDQFEAVFYLGTVFDTPLPGAFLEEVNAAGRPVCWFKYNLWRLASHQGESMFTNRFGFRFDSVDTSVYDQVVYGGETFTKDPRDPDLGRVMILDPGRVDVLAWANRGGSNALPYAVRSGSFYYVADSPFSFISEEDRYLVLADLLHDILGEDHPATHRALLRLEDVSPDYPVELLLEASDLMSALDIPFSVGLIPVHEDPLGVFNGGLPHRVGMVDRPAFLSAVRGLVSAGGQLLLHGYTHQYRDLPNPYSGVSGDDFEFYRVETDETGAFTTFAPVPEETMAWVQERVESAKQAVRAAGFHEAGWVTPHYTASPLAARVFATNFPVLMQRGIYFDDDGHHVSQFFPYVIERDIYGQRILPENLGNVSEPSAAGGEGRRVEDILRSARKSKVIRDGWAGTFFHPFLDLQELRALVEGLQELGYAFVPVRDEMPPSVCGLSNPPHYEPGASFSLEVQACGTGPLSYQWSRNGVVMEGETNDVLWVGNFSGSDLGTYTVRVANALGSVVSPPLVARFLVEPAITGLAITNGAFSVWIEAREGLDYSVEYQDFLGQPAWSRTLPVTGRGTITNLVAPLGGLDQRFYRVRVE